MEELEVSHQKSEDEPRQWCNKRAIFVGLIGLIGIGFIIFMGYMIFGVATRSNILPCILINISTSRTIGGLTTFQNISYNGGESFENSSIHLNISVWTIVRIWNVNNEQCTFTTTENVSSSPEIQEIGSRTDCYFEYTEDRENCEPTFGSDDPTQMAMGFGIFVFCLIVVMVSVIYGIYFILPRKN